VIEIFGIPLQAFLGSSCWFGQWRVLRHAQPGLAVIFGLLDIVNFARRLYMLGAGWFMPDQGD
jgi:hypothetical protein